MFEAKEEAGGRRGEREGTAYPVVAVKEEPHCQRGGRRKERIACHVAAIGGAWTAGEGDLAIKGDYH